MLTIDADAHVIENEATWDYLEGSDRRFRPVPVSADMPAGTRQSVWIIDGRLIGGRDNVGAETPREAREMTDIDRRLRHMDEIGTGVQVLYPTVLLRPFTERPDVELALCRAYKPARTTATRTPPANCWRSRGSGTRAKSHPRSSTRSLPTTPPGSTGWPRVTPATPMGSKLPVPFPTDPVSRAGLKPAPTRRVDAGTDSAN